MKVQVKDLHSNPYRHMEKYPIQRDKVEALKTSIGETEFWDNVLARKNGAIYEIAYGHHRLTALQELKIKEVDIPVKEIDDAKMIRIMANENMDDWKSSPAVVNETVSVAKEFIDAEMAKAETWKDANKSISVLFDNQHSFEQTKNQGAGQNTILRFLGGNWKQWMIQNALAIFKDEKEGIIDREAVEEMPSMQVANEFRRAVKSAGVPKAKRYGIEVVRVDPYHTSQTCSVCGNYEEGQREKQAEFECKKCGTKLNADYNAAKNIAMSDKIVSRRDECEYWKLASGRPISRPKGEGPRRLRRSKPLAKLASA